MSLHASPRDRIGWLDFNPLTTVLANTCPWVGVGLFEGVEGDGKGWSRGFALWMVLGGHGVMVERASL